jgi:cytidyltransferase-like protein
MSDLSLVIGRQERDLRDLPLDFTVGVITGSFDPVHLGHIEMADSALAYEGFRINMVLFYVHNQTPGKSPAPYDVRVRILTEIIAERPLMGIIKSDNIDRDIPEGHTWNSWLFSRLRDYHPLRYCKVISCERVKYAANEDIDIDCLVSPRYDVPTELPKRFHLLPGIQRTKMSSTDIREGKRPLGKEYDAVKELIVRYYPRALFVKD